MKKLLPLALCLIFLVSCVQLRPTDTAISYETPKADTDLTETTGTTDTEEIVPPPVEEPPLPFEGVSISVAAVGDNLIHSNLYIDANRRAGYNGYDFKPLYESITPIISAADIAFINQETLMAGEEYGYSHHPCFNSPQQLGIDLVEIGFDVINMANNHMLDKMNVKGLLSTMDFWDTQPVTTLGDYRDQADAETVRVTECQGVRIAWLSYTYWTNGINKQADSPVVIPYIDEELILADLERAKLAGDFVIVSIHVGTEGSQVVTEEQKYLFKLMADNGADVILGHHSHTLQPIEWIETDRGRTLAIYSLGNFVSGQAAPVNMPGGILQFNIVGREGKLTVEDVVFEPTVNYYGWDWMNTRVYLLSEYTEEIAKNHGIGMYGYTMTPAQAEEYVRNVMAEEFLPDWMKN